MYRNGNKRHCKAYPLATFSTRVNFTFEMTYGITLTFNRCHPLSWFFTLSSIKTSLGGYCVYKNIRNQLLWPHHQGNHRWLLTLATDDAMTWTLTGVVLRPWSITLPSIQKISWTVIMYTALKNIYACTFIQPDALQCCEEITSPVYQKTKSLCNNIPK